MHSRETFLIDL